ncbi:MAG: efflux RND transporter permease subunit [Pseudomonadota bacterium]
MNLPELCIRRPVLATVLSLVVVLVGLVSFQRLSVREYPNIDPPVVNVETFYPGASAAIIESQVTKILEESLAGLEGVDVMTSISREEFSQVTLTFLLSRDPESAASDVRDRVSRARGSLPTEVRDPVVQKTEADAQPVMYLAFSSDRHDPMFITDFADRRVKDRLQSLPGVALVMILAERRYSMRITLQPERLAAFGMTPADIEDALRRQNVEIPAGRIESSQREFTVSSETDLRTVDQFNELILRDRGGFLVRLRDVGQANIVPEEERFAARFKGQTAVALGVVKQSTANPLDVSDGVTREMEAIRQSLPPGMNVEVAYDSAVFIRASINNVFETIAEAVGLVVLIIFFFLRSLRATLIPLVTIPVSLLGACAVMVALGFSINTLTLLAAVLAIGLVVDDAIVMLENIHRHVEAGVPPFEAALRGAREIGFAIIAMTLTLAAVYAPVGFQPGTTGKLFTEFAWTLAGAVIVSGFVALTLSPMMCALLLKHETKHGALFNSIEALIRGVTQGYRNALAFSLRTRWLVILVGAGVAFGGALLFLSLKSELSPTEDRGVLLGVYIAPEGSTLAYTDSYAKRLEAMYREIPEVNRYFVITGFPVVTNGISFVRVNDWAQRTRSIFEIQQELGPKMFAGAPGVLAFPITPGSLGQNFLGKPVSVVIQTSQTYEDLAGMMTRLTERVGKIPGVLNIESDLQLNKPQLKVELDRDKAAAMGVNPIEVGRALETLLGGREVTRFKKEGEQYNVVVKLADVDRSNPDDLNRIYVRNSSGLMIGLANVIRTQEGVAPKELNHFNQLRAATLTASLGPELAQGEALKLVAQAAREVLPDVQLDYSGSSREFFQSSSGIAFTLGLALVFIFLVLSAQFESFVDPFIIMLTVPFAMAGAFLALSLSGNTWNIYSQVGIVTLVGLITKHGILIVEFSNQLREAGRSLNDAVIEAATLRLRPILMTTGAMVLGAVPLAIAVGAGAESRQAIGWAIVGGLLVGTLFTLFVVPTVYTLLARPRTATPA